MKVQRRNGPQKRRHNQKGNLSPEVKDPKDAAKRRLHKFDCADCKKWYIGETGQKMESRKYQHQKDVKGGEKNAFFMHLQTHKTHSIRWQEVVYLENKEDWKKRKIKEAL